MDFVDAGVFLDLEDGTPGDAAVCGLVEAAVAAGFPEWALSQRRLCWSCAVDPTMPMCSESLRPTLVKDLPLSRSNVDAIAVCAAALESFCRSRPRW